MAEGAMTLPDPGHPFDAVRVKQARAGGIDGPMIAALTRDLLLAIGESPVREGLEDTPARVALLWAEFTHGYREDPAAHLDRAFETEDSDLVLQRDIAFYSLCEHHLVPFFGVAHVAYIPNENMVGLSKIVRMVRGYASMLQVQERLTAQIADAMNAKLDPLGVAVVLRAEHLCIGMRGIKVPNSVTISSAMRGAFKDDPRARAEILELLQ
jgi:GTP cyclohydrolase I